MGRYAKGTEVSAAKSRAEIERTLARYGATKFAYATEEGRAAIGFVMCDRRVRFDLPLPCRSAREFTHTPDKGLERSPLQAEKAWEQACREQWRALALGIKAKLAFVESGITVFEKEFLSQLVLPNGETVGNAVIPQLEQMEGPSLLPYFQ